MKSEVKRTERGWAGHFISSPYCRFRRNTLLEYKEVKIVVSTVGDKRYNSDEGRTEKIGSNRYYETRCFHSDSKDPSYHDIDVKREEYVRSKWRVDHFDDGSDNEANDIHETIVMEITENMLMGDYDDESG